MKKKFILWLLSVTIIFSASAQSSWQWGRGNTGGVLESWCVAVDPYGDIFGAGFAASSDVYFDSIVVHYPFPSVTGNPQVVISKYNAIGNIIWAKGIMTGPSQPINITTDPWGNLLLLGIFYDHITIDTFNLYIDTSYSSQYFIVKFDSGGHVLWAKTSSETTTGASGFNCTSGSVGFISWGGIATDFSGNIFVTGNFNSSIDVIGTYTLTNKDPTVTTDDIFVAAYDTSGNVLWANSIGGTNSDDALGITVASTGNVYISGTFMSDTLVVGPDTVTDGYGVQIALLAEFSPTGAPLWGQAAGGANGAYGAGLASDHAGNIFLTGSFGDSAIIFGSDTIRRTYPASVPALAAYLVKLSDTNSVVWQKTIGSPSCNIIGFSIGRGNTEDGAVWVSGSWSPFDSLSTPFVMDSANIDGNMLYTPDSSFDPVFIAGYDMGGYVLGYAALQSGADDQNGIAIDQMDNVYICADYAIQAGYTYFLVGPDTLTCNTSLVYVETQYIAKYGLPSPSNASHLTNITPQYMIYPNPANNELVVTATTKISGISITNLLGQTVYSSQFDAENVQIDISYLTPGVYFIKINEVYTAKFVKE